MHCSDTFRLVFMMGLVMAYFLIELIVGNAIKSLSLVADSFHMLSDFIALTVAVAAARIAKWPRSSKNTFGWQRAEVVGSLINTVVLVTLCFTILVDAAKRFINRELIDDPRLMTYVGFGGLLINVLGLLVIGGHSHSHDTPSLEIVDTANIGDRASDMTVDSKQNGIYTKNEVYKDERGRLSVADGSHISVYDVQDEDFPGRSCSCFKKRQTPARDIEHENCHLSQCPTSTKKNSHPAESRRLAKAGRKKRSMNMRAVFLHVLADFFGSITVCISALLLWFIPGDPEVSPNQWKFYVDPAMSVVMVAIILSSTVPLLRKAALILLQSVPSEICIDNLQSRLEKLDGVKRVHDLHVWKLQSNCIIGTAHIRCRSLTEYVTVARSVKQLFHEYNIHCTTIQPEFEDDEGLEPDTCMYDCGPNRNCQQDTCCPQPASSTSSGNNHNHGSNSSHTSLAINNITYQSSGNALDTMLTTDTAYKSEANGKPSELKQEFNQSTDSFEGLRHSTIEMDHFTNGIPDV